GACGCSASCSCSASAGCCCSASSSAACCFAQSETSAIVSSDDDSEVSGDLTLSCCAADSESMRSDVVSLAWSSVSVICHLVKRATAVPREVLEQVPGLLPVCF